MFTAPAAAPPAETVCAIVAARALERHGTGFQRVRAAGLLGFHGPIVPAVRGRRCGDRHQLEPGYPVDSGVSRGFARSAYARSKKGTAREGGPRSVRSLHGALGRPSPYRGAEPNPELVNPSRGSRICPQGRGPCGIREHACMFVVCLIQYEGNEILSAQTGGGDWLKKHENRGSIPQLSCSEKARPLRRGRGGPPHP